MKITCNKDLSYLCLHHHNVDHKTDIVKEEVKFVVKDNDEDSVYIVPVGYVTDGYSIPSVFVWIIKNERVNAALMHDFMCSLARDHKDYNLQKRADTIFREYLVQTGVSKWKANVMYWAVKSYSWWKYQTGVYD